MKERTCLEVLQREDGSVLVVKEVDAAKTHG